MNREEFNEKKKALYDRHFNQACKHLRFERRKQIISNGSFQVKHQCLDCGAISQSKKQQTGDCNLKEVDVNMRALKWAERSEAYQRELEQLECALKQQMSFEYQEYLHSQEWQEMRQKVFQRDNNICQGCLAQKATRIHHLTYDNVKSELCFQLVSLCESCHAKIHRKE